MDPLLQLASTSASLSDRIYTHVVEGILQGEYAQTARLPTETALATRFGVSRPTVREALSRLRSDGIVTSRRGSGSYVARLPGAPAAEGTPIKSMADIDRYYTFRSCVEAGAAAGAAEMRDAADIEVMASTFRMLTDAMENQRAGVEEDVRFHLAIARASHNQFFVSTIETSVGPIRQFMELARNLTDKKDLERVREVQREHQAILDAIVRRSSFDAAEATRAHILAARRRIFEGTPLR